MLKAIFEGNLDIFLSSDVDMTAGQLVKLDPDNEGKILVAGVDDDVYGVVAQDVADPSVDNFKLDSVTHVAGKGRDKVGVYFNGGLYYTDQFVGSVAVGDKLYAGADGQLSATGGEGAEPVAVAQTSGDASSGDKIRIKLLK